MAGAAASTPSRTERSPDLFEPVLGVRFWRVSAAGGLRCLVGRELWLPGVNTATCWRRHHQAPSRLCDCGFNALHRLPESDDERHRGTILGAIAAWGQIDVHRRGFRAQHASVIALAEGGVARPPSRRRLLRAAERYSVPLVPSGSLSAVAMGSARPLDPVLLPGRRATAESTI